MRDRQAVYRYRELGHEGCMVPRKIGMQARIQAVQNRGSEPHIESVPDTHTRLDQQSSYKEHRFALGVLSASVRQNITVGWDHCPVQTNDRDNGPNLLLVDSIPPLALVACKFGIVGTIDPICCLGSTGIRQIVRKERAAHTSRRIGSHCLGDPNPLGHNICQDGTVFLLKIATVLNSVQDLHYTLQSGG